MLKNREAGFTLIEITLVMAISLSLGVIVFAGSSSLRNNAKFTDAVERSKEMLVAAKNEANTTVNTRDEAISGDDDNRLMLGRAIVYFGQSGTYRKYNLIGADVDAPTPTEVELVSQANIPWGVQVGGATVNERKVVAFLRTPLGVQAYYFQGSAASDAVLEDMLKNAGNYTPAASTGTLILSDGLGRTAKVNVTTPSGLITREFLP